MLKYLLSFLHEFKQDQASKSDSSIGKEIRAVVESVFMILLIDLQSPSIDGLLIALAKEICDKTKRVEASVL